MADAAKEAGVEALFEVRDEAELSWALDAGARMIGVNRRNLETLEMEHGVIEQIVPMIPSFLHAIAESGVDFISVGRITQSAPAVDIGLDYSLQELPA